jgi:hypothetical protein
MSVEGECRREHPRKMPRARFVKMRMSKRHRKGSSSEEWRPVALRSIVGLFAALLVSLTLTAAASANWGAGTNLGGSPLGSAPVAGVDAAGDEFVFWRGEADSGLWEKSYHHGRWNQAVRVTIARKIGSAPAVAVHANGQADVFWKGTDGNLWEAVYSHGWRAGTDLEASPLGSAPAAGVDAAGDEFVFWRGKADSGLWEKSYSDGRWNTPIRVTIAGTIGSAPAVAVHANGQADVFWTGTDGNLWEAVYQPTKPPPPSRTLKVALVGSGSGTVKGGGIDCPGTCSHSYTSGTKVTLTAAPASGSSFTSWSGAGCSGRSTCTVTMNSAETVTATFTANAPSGPSPGSYSGTDSPGFGVAFYVSGDSSQVQDITVSDVGLTCSNGTSTGDENFTIAAAPITSGVAFTATSTQTEATETITYTFTGHFHGLNTSGNTRAAGQLSETISFTTGTSYTCTSSNLSWSATR